MFDAHPFKLCLIKDDEDILIFKAENRLYLSVCTGRAEWKRDEKERINFNKKG